MQNLPQRIMQYAESRTEATPLCPAGLLHLGRRESVVRALSRLARSGKLMRICHGVYLHPVETRFGRCPPSIDKALKALSTLWGETFVPSGGSAANRLGLTTQNPIREVYLTSGRDRQLHFGGITVELRHAPRWQLVATYRKAGDVIRALSWFGPKEINEQLDAIIPKLSPDELEELSSTRAVMPIWMAQPLSARIAHS